MTIKRITQLVSTDGKAIATATSAPGWFVLNGAQVKGYESRQWGDTFAPPRSGNKVEFFVTGEEYFDKVAAAFLAATESIYITGWQVNFDVVLANGRTLFEHLETAMTANPRLQVYVMPWLSPKVGVDTFDFETMLAMFQLNAGMAGPPRAFVLPAIAQSDQQGGLAIGFSHHQKLVVVDEKIAFVGGIDLAYGRRDNGKFLLRADWRKGNELYNPCIPPIHEMSKLEQVNLLTRWEMLAACFGGVEGWLAEWWFSASGTPIAFGKDVFHVANEAIADAKKHGSNWWESGSILPAFLDEWKKQAMENTERTIRTGYQEVDSRLGGKLEFLRTSSTAYVSDSSAAMVGWLNNASLEALPAELRAETVKLLQTFIITLVIYLHAKADKLKERYDNLKDLRKMLPLGGFVLAPSQPRMPWHDVHSSIEGPSVSDLCRNFEGRWNGVARGYEKSHHTWAGNVLLNKVFSTLRMTPMKVAKLPRIKPSRAAETYAKTGSSWVQVLRSAPLHLLKDEDPLKKSEKPAKAQDNCMMAILTAISSAQHFIYIEGQFFQSGFGENNPEQDAQLSGPLAALIDITASPQYEKYKRLLGIDGVAVADISKTINWSKISEVTNDKNFENFKRDLVAVLKNAAAIKASKLMGKEQKKLLNPIGEALAKCIEDAIKDNRPFHIYIVLPVHPEGTLNTLNIITQVHLTMQSLVFGSHSLVNRIRRLIIAKKLRLKNKITFAEAIKTAEAYSTEQLIDEDEWMEYLTLLNLRNWDALGKRPVTEQVYVHSKLLIADDRVAILGSANLNDRSLMGDRDSELAIIVRDDTKERVKLNGKDEQPISKAVHTLRVRLWNKLFGLSGGMAPANELRAVVDKPSAPETWKAIQKVAKENALAYQRAFPFLARIVGEPSSIWPAWDIKSRKLDFFMPFNDLFWRSAEVRDEAFTWDAKRRAEESTPTGIKGFIVALPVSWTMGENNVSGMNLTLLANTEKDVGGHPTYAAADETNSEIHGINNTKHGNNA